MKVDLIQQVSGQGPLELAPRGSASTASVAAQPSTVQDRTTLSSSGSAVSSLVSQAMSSPEVRQDKVDALKQQIANGTYKVDPKKIAQGILEDAT